MKLKEKKHTVISYRELTEKLHGVVLCNNINQVDEDSWYESFIVGPLLQQHMEELDEELAAEHNITPEELGEHSGVPEPTSVLDLAEGCIYQSYIIDDVAARDLVNHTTELVTYSDTLDVFVWHVTHFGTSWSGVHLNWYDRSDDIDENHTQYAGITEELLKWRNG